MPSCGGVLLPFGRSGLRAVRVQLRRRSSPERRFRTSAADDDDNGGCNDNGRDHHARDDDYEQRGCRTTTSSTSTSSTSINLGKTVLLKARTKTSGCTLGPLPDRRCSPGAYYSGLTKAVICSSTFRTGPIRNVPDSEKHAVEIEYGLAPKGYGSTLEIDHITSLLLGGSNDIANLYPEEATFTGHQPGFHVKDKLEVALGRWVCQGRSACVRRSSRSPRTGSAVQEGVRRCTDRLMSVTQACGWLISAQTRALRASAIASRCRSSLRRCSSSR